MNRDSWSRVLQLRLLAQSHYNVLCTADIIHVGLVNKSPQGKTVLPAGGRGAVLTWSHGDI